MATDAIRFLLLSAILLTALTAISFGATKKPTTKRSAKKPSTTTKMPVSEGFRESGLHPGIIQTNDADYMTLLHREMIVDGVSRKLKNSSVPSLNGTMSLILSSQRLIYEIEDIKVVDDDELEVKVKVDLSNGHVLQVDVTEVTLEGNYSLAEESELLRTDNITGNFTLVLDGISVRCVRSMKISKENGEILEFKSISSNISIDDFEFLLENPTARELLSLTLYDVVKQHIATHLLKAVNYFTDFDLNYGHDRSKLVYMDMTLLSPPEVKDGRIVLSHRGEIRFRDEESADKNLLKTPVPDGLASVEYVVSVFTLGSYCDIVQRHKLLDSVFSQDDLPADKKHFLSTDDVKNGFGRMFPNASKPFPNASVVIEAKTTKKPLVTINESALHMIFYFRITVSANMTNGTKKTIFTADITLTYSVYLSVKRGRVVLHFSPAKEQEITAVDSMIGPLKNEDVLTVASHVFAKNMGPFYAQWATEGIRLSSSKTLHESRSQWKILDQSLVLYLEYERQQPQKKDKE